METKPTEELLSEDCGRRSEGERPIRAELKAEERFFDLPPLYIRKGVVPQLAMQMKWGFSGSPSAGYEECILGRQGYQLNS